MQRGHKAYQTAWSRVFPSSKWASLRVVPRASLRVFISVWRVFVCKQGITANMHRCGPIRTIEIPCAGTGRSCAPDTRAGALGQQPAPTFLQPAAMPGLSSSSRIPAESWQLRQPRTLPQPQRARDAHVPSTLVRVPTQALDSQRTHIGAPATAVQSQSQDATSALLPHTISHYEPGSPAALTELTQCVSVLAHALATQRAPARSANASRRCAHARTQRKPRTRSRSRVSTRPASAPTPPSAPSSHASPSSVHARSATRGRAQAGTTIPASLLRRLQDLAPRALPHASHDPRNTKCGSVPSQQHDVGGGFPGTQPPSQARSRMVCGHACHLYLSATAICSSYSLMIILCLVRHACSLSRRGRVSCCAGAQYSRGHSSEDCVVGARRRHNLLPAAIRAQQQRYSSCDASRRCTNCFSELCRGCAGYAGAALAAGALHSRCAFDAQR